MHLQFPLKCPFPKRHCFPHSIHTHPPSYIHALHSSHVLDGGRDHYVKLKLRLQVQQKTVAACSTNTFKMRKRKENTRPHKSKPSSKMQNAFLYACTFSNQAEVRLHLTGLQWWDAVSDSELQENTRVFQCSLTELSERSLFFKSQLIYVCMT